ncbi:hypothetical protein QO002_001826 [Pararhizobium capsulatum DSM 1112]|uniref:Integral membrane protein n=1 Tax=Pararhizobium capsulatum DSM 1112 TaxID=1121113 RepID=A0ABU0BP37_9HYPH|nr:hypothetical protein [Pararhizobium capsulatum]MDQ0319688.1 hypothetical protein [Pararhizobium capsulatum DSM 1112]
MPTLENNRLVFRFPQIEESARFSINFQRTLRIPDTEKTYPLPPGLGSFPLRHVEDYPGKLPAETTARGGVILPMWQAEAMWLSFRNSGPNWDLNFPVAIKVAAGKINAVTGDSWRSGLHREPQDYMVSPEQPWLDGFAIEKGVIRQFVAMPLGEGYSVEEQLTGEAEWGGLQISVAPLKAEVWQQRRREWEEQQERRREEEQKWLLEQQQRRADVPMSAEHRMPSLSVAEPMGLSAGGRMVQEIHPDPFQIDDWDIAAADRVFVSLLHAKDWKTITGEAAPNQPPTAKQYSDAGLPWFEHYGRDQGALPGSAKLAGVKSAAELFIEKTGAILPNSQDVKTGVPKALGPRSKGPRPIRTNGSWMGLDGN